MSSVRELASLQLPGVRFGTLPAEPLRRLPTGIGALDTLLGGGLPRGHVSEIVGSASSGRTALLHALLASATQRGEVTAVIDLPDALDPPSLARAGVDLERVLWVRPPSARMALKCAELILTAGGFGLLALDGLHAPLLRPRSEPAHRPLPPHVWPRLAQVTRRAGAVCLVCAPRRYAGGAAALALTLTQRRAQWDARLFDGFTTTAVLTRSRFGPAETAIELTVGERRGAPDAGSAERWQAMRRRGGEAAVQRAIAG